MRLKSRTIKREALSDKQKLQMYNLFTYYYDNVSKEKFEKDLSDKELVILLLWKNEIKGFSTLKIFSQKLEGKDYICVFSGDTIIDESFWGQTSLTMEFFKNVLRVKMRHLNKEVYWFLISKGYKTYLLLTNNYFTYYPRYDRPTPEKHRKLIALFAKNLFGEYYNEEKNLLIFGNNCDRLKQAIAPITEKELKNPNIAYFHQANPHHFQGDELCCIGRNDLGLILRYSCRTFLKRFKNLFRRRRVEVVKSNS